MPNSKKAQKADAIALLKADHRTVEALFEKFEKTKAKAQKAKIAEQICMELSIHATIEEELFYPIFQGTIDDDLLNEAYVEHDGAKLMIAEIMAGSPDDQFYDAKIKVLSEEIKHHVKEEEQKDGIFFQARKTDCDFAELGAQMLERKEELKAMFMKKGIPDPETRSLQGAKLIYGEPVKAKAA